jgi:hypothetical protein
LKKGLSSPNLILRKCNKAYFEHKGSYKHNANGKNIIESEWDNLLILDACRYDIFKNQNVLKGNLKKIESMGSSTTEFLISNLSDRNLHDTVYITANPQYYRHKDTINCEFHNVIHVWKDDGWDSKYQTVLPETVTEYGLHAASKYSNKRLIVHYIQPHYPFLDSEVKFDKGQLYDPNNDESFWARIMTGKLSIERSRIWQLYNDNLEYVLSTVRDLADTIDGNTVVTSDHGNMIGEHSFPIPISEWGHPRGTHTSQLVEVPWLELGGNDRKIVPDPPVDQSDNQYTEVVTDRLQSLGYT